MRVRLSEMWHPPRAARCRPVPQMALQELGGRMHGDHLVGRLVGTHEQDGYTYAPM